jgi:serine/threonine protein kinase/formylglycine-generating enzyme required for sulfatase activity
MDVRPGSRSPLVSWSPPSSFAEYRLVRFIARGGMGQVYLARDTLLDRAVAVKFIAAIRPDERARKRFSHEARAIARLQHPNVVAIHRVGEVDGRPFLVAEFVRGQSLAELSKPIPWERARQIGVGLARGLASAHRQGILHRDIKPGNVMLAEDGTVKLLDFGLAKLLEQEHAGVPESIRGIFRHSGVIPIVQSSGAEIGAPGEGAPITHELTSSDGVFGTPVYMAPEALRGEPATRCNDVYSLGAVLYELCAGVSPRQSVPDDLSYEDWINAEPTPLLELSPGIDPRFADIVSRCLLHDPARRFASADALGDALEHIGVGKDTREMPEGNPYRGLSPFEAEHRSLFFGRNAEVQEVIERLRAESFVLIVGDSGVGKSSLCRAGVLPKVMEGAIRDGRRYTVFSLVPGKHPLAELSSRIMAEQALHVCPEGRDALDDVVGSERIDDAEALVRRMRADPGSLAREIARTLGHREGALILVDQVEELFTLSAPEEAACFSEVLAHLGALKVGVRVLMTVRGDFFTRLAALPGLGEEISRALYLLRPLSPAATRAAVIGPARRAGVTFESERMIDALVESSTRAAGGLPLLQFAMAELWEARSLDQQTIPEAALDAIGGVAGALARHADGVLAALLPEQRRSARRLLLRLITEEGTRARRTAAELDSADPASRVAREALIHGRLLVAREVDDETTYEIAHEALVQGWETLRGWLGTDGEKRRIRARLEATAAEWVRLERAQESLWSERRLATAVLVDEGELSAIEAEFLAASRRAARANRLRRWALLAAAPLLVLLGLVGLRLKARHDLDQVIAAHETEGRAAMEKGKRRKLEAEAHQSRAFELFDALRSAAGAEARARRDEAEQVWASALAASRQAEAALAGASQSFDAGLALDPASTKLRALIGDVHLERIGLAERFYAEERRHDLLVRLALYDEGGERRRWLTTSPRLSIETTPAGAEVVLERYEDDAGNRRPVLVGVLGRTPIVEQELAGGPGSYRLTFEAPGRATVRLPIVLSRAERVQVKIDLPAREAVPEGYVYIPPGRFLFGSNAVDGLRRGMLNTYPLHEVSTGGYLIGRNEVTFGDWLQFLRDQPPSERAPYLLNSQRRQLGVDLELLPSGEAKLTLVLNNERISAREGEPLVIAGRSRRVTQDWRRFPVSAISMGDAQAYMDWLDRTGRLHRARFCDEREWERASRGADDRSFPHGNQLAADDADFDQTYGRVSGAFGPDEVGSHPASESPFGLHDMAGNVYEWTRGAGAADEVLIRSGAWYYDQITLRVDNRTSAERNTRDYAIGLRICADL